MDSKKKLIGGVIVIGVVIIAFVGGRLSVGKPDHSGHADGGDAPAKKKATTWTCSMHPQIKQPKSGKCPICFMDLIALEDDGGGGGGPRDLRLSESARALAEIQVAPVRRTFVTRSVRLVGKVTYDETRLATIAAWVPGRLDRLYVDYTGVAVKKGDHMVYLYSPAILTAQEELLQAAEAARKLKSSSVEGMVESAMQTLEAAREKLRLWGLSGEQVKKLESKGKAGDHIQINAPIGGIVVHKNAVEGNYVKTGSPIYRIADLSRVWVKLDAYESDLPWLRYGQEVEFSSDSFPGETLRGRIAFIDPILDAMSRTVKVRVNVDNPKGRLKPGMFVRAVAKVQVAEGGKVRDTELVGKWISPMHPEVVKDGPGKCDVCGMPLVPAEELGFVSGDGDVRPPLVIPASAAMITGTRAVVYVQDPKDSSRFSGKQIALGPRADDFYVVEGGLEEGELVVVNGNFKIDSALQLLAKPSMMSADDGQGPAKKKKALEVHSAPAEFLKQLGPLFDGYFATGKHFSKDSLDKAKASGAELVKKLSKVDMKLVKGKAHVAWMGRNDEIAKAAVAVRSSKDMDGGRLAFKDLSAAMTRLAKQFGTGGDREIYVNICSMAFDNTGAEWLQENDGIENPYFGSQMYRCGERVSALKPVPGKPGQLMKHKAPRAFLKQIAPLFGHYFAAGTHFSKDSLEKAKASGGELVKQLKSVDMKLVGGKAHMAWMGRSDEITKAATEVRDAKNMDKGRLAFKALSIAMKRLARQFGTGGDREIYVNTCPMAFNDTGAQWLQQNDGIENPYFGSTMYRCGERVSILKPAEPDAGKPSKKMKHDGHKVEGEHDGH